MGEPDYSVILPAFNEEGFLPLSLPRLFAAMDQVDLCGEVIVVDNNSTDLTAQIASELGATVVFEKINQISRARNKGAEVARGRYFVFLDSDTLVSPELLQKSLELLSHKKAIGGGSLLTCEGVKIGDKPNKGVRLWNWVSVTLNLAAGSFIFVSREAYQQSGGFSTLLFAGEEINFSKKIKRIGRKQGLKFVIIKDHPIETSMRKLDWYSNWQIARMWAIIFIFPFVLYSSKLLPFWYHRPDDPIQPEKRQD